MHHFSVFASLWELSFGGSERRAVSFLETLMAMRAAGFYISLLPRLCHGALHRQITSCGLLPLHRQTLQRVSMAERKQSLRPKVVRASSSLEYESGSSHSGRSIVDANMPLLRKRINKLKIQEEERKRDGAAPEEEFESEWMECQKKLYPTYHFKVCEIIGLLHNYLIEARSSVALAFLSLTVFVAAASVLVLLVTIVNSLHLSRLGA